MASSRPTHATNIIQSPVDVLTFGMREARPYGFCAQTTLTINGSALISSHSFKEPFIILSKSASSFTYPRPPTLVTGGLRPRCPLYIFSLALQFASEDP